MSDRLEHNPQVFAVVMPSGRLVYVSLAKREEFDRLPLPCTDHGEDRNGHILSKALDADGVRIVFQFWQKRRTDEAFSADLAEARARKATTS